MEPTKVLKSPETLMAKKNLTINTSNLSNDENNSE